VRAFGRMRSLPHFLFADIAASQMVEFAVCLPFLVVVVVGIFDFGEAFNLKQKLNGAATVPPVKVLRISSRVSSAGSLSLRPPLVLTLAVGRLRTRM
jgi:hypothetical protein